MITLNAFAILILAALVLDFVLGLVAVLLNLRALGLELPEPFRDVHDAETYRRSQDYTRTRSRFGLLLGTVQLALLLVFWFAGGFELLDGTIRGWGFGPISTGVLFFGALGLAATMLALPAGYYATFVIEERFGFNTSTRRTFWSDTLKALLLSVALGVPLLVVVLALFLWAGPRAWLYCWAASTLYIVAIQFVAPAWIMPLFNRFEPLEPGELREAILAYADKVGFSLRGVFVIDGSRRSSKANAFFTGFGRNRRIALFDTLIDKHATDQVVAVVAHEVGHYKKRHLLQGMVFGILHSGVIFGLLGFFLAQPGLYAAFGMSQPSVHAGLVFFGLLFTPVELLLSFALHAWSRRNEYEADRYAAQTTGRAEDLVQALKQLSADSLANLTPHPFYVAMHYSHPPVLRRIEALRRMPTGREARA